MRTYILIAAALLLFVAAACSHTGGETQENVPRIVNFINFVRELEPRPGKEHITPEVLFETTRKEAEAIHAWGFRGTWLLQYDALIDPRYQELMREELSHGCEVGGWWEITQPHVEAAGIAWRGRYPWDWHADKGFSVGYTQQEREMLVDVYMSKFRELFGRLPNSVGSWFIDAYSLAYMREKYGIEGCCICRDQVGTDGYTLWGGYWQGAYYPSAQNAYMPAQTPAGQIDLPVFRMLGSDPLYQYNAGVGGSVQKVSTLEPACEKGRDPQWVDWYLRCQTDDPALGYTYLQAGQENSFTWQAIEKGYEVQLPRIAALEKQGKLRVETLAESARNFRKKYPLTPPTACSALEDYTDRHGKTLWFNSRFYRASILWEGDSMAIRDLHLFDERVTSPYYHSVCTSNKCVYMTLPVVDGCLWSTEDDMAGLRFYSARADGTLTQLCGTDPSIDAKDERLTITWPLKDIDASIVLTFDEGRMHIRSIGKKLNWCMMLHVSPEAVLPFTGISERCLTAEQNGYSYQITLSKGRFTGLRSKGDGSVFLIEPQRDCIELDIEK